MHTSTGFHLHDDDDVEIEARRLPDREYLSYMVVGFRSDAQSVTIFFESRERAFDLLSVLEEALTVEADE